MTINIVYLHDKDTNYVETCITYAWNCCFISTLFMYKDDSEARQPIRKHPYR